MSTLGDLTVRDVGRRMRIRTGTTTIEGQLRGYDVRTDWSHEVTLSMDQTKVDPVPGRQTGTIRVGPWEATDLPLDAEVEFL